MESGGTRDYTQYGRGTRIFFAFMMLVLGGGFPLMLLMGIPQVQDLVTGGTSGNKQQVKIVEDGHEKLIDNKCTVLAKPKGKTLKTCKETLVEMGGAYTALAQPEQQIDPDVPPEEPENAELNLAKSLEAYELLYALDPKDRDSTKQLASAYSAQGKYEQALPLYEKLIKQEPEAELIFALAITQQSAGKNDEAIKTYRRYIKLAPESSEADTAREQIKTLKEQAASGGAGGLGGGSLGGLPGGINFG